MNGWRGDRMNVRFSADGRHAACLAVDDRDRVHLEGWVLTGRGPRRHLRVPLVGDPMCSYAVPVAGGRLLLAGWWDARRQLALVGPAGVLSSRPVPELRITAAPPGLGLALGLAGTPAGTTEVFRIEDDLDSGGDRWRPPVAALVGAVPADGIVAGSRVILHTRTHRAAAPVLVDVATSEVSALPAPPAAELVPIDAAGDTLLVAVSAGGRHRLGTVSLRAPGAVEPLTGLDHLDGSVRPLALHPDGTEVVLRVRHGARSRLLRHRLASRRTEEVAAPPGTAQTRAAWTDGGLWLPYTTTTSPVDLWWLPPGGATLRPPPDAPVATGPPGRVETLPGAAGPVEAVAYGDWRASDRLVLALHGGPAAHWPLAFDPVLQAFAAAGFAVVAPNPRGSTGYGRAYQEAIKGAWGGPDLADILAIGSHLVHARGDRRALPALYGASYGGFLGLLAMAGAPARWSGCAAIAPFRSGARLYADAVPPIRALLDRLDGTATIVDGLGPRDLVRLAPRMRGRILVLHGEHDTTIPVHHSRELVAALARQPGVEVSYRELAGHGHNAVRPRPGTPELAEIVRFLHGPGRGAPVVGGGSSGRAPTAATTDGGR